MDAEQLFKPLEAPLTPAEIDTIIRCRWLAGVSAADIRAELGIRHIGVLGARVHALGLPPRDHLMRLMWGERRLPALRTDERADGGELTQMC